MVTKKEQRERLRSVRLFEGLSKADLDYVINVSRVAEHSAGHTFISEGDPGVGFNLILAGEARVVHGDRTVAHLGPGDYFGEMSLIDGGPRTATIIADTPITALGITSWDFRPMVKREPRIAWKLLVHLTGRLREAQDIEDSLRA